MAASDWSQYAGDTPDLATGPRWPWPVVQTVNGTDDAPETPAFWSRKPAPLGFGGAEGSALFASGECEDGWIYGPKITGRIVAIREAYAAEAGDEVTLHRSYAEGRRGRLQLAILADDAAWDPAGELPIVILTLSGVKAQRARKAIGAFSVTTRGVPLWGYRVSCFFGAAESHGTGRNRYTVTPVELAFTGPSDPDRDFPAGGPDAIAAWRHGGEGGAWRREWAELPR